MGLFGNILILDKVSCSLILNLEEKMFIFVIDESMNALEWYKFYIS